MQERLAEIVINFRGVPHPILQATSGEPINRLVISLQPDEGLRLAMMAKAAVQRSEAHTSELQSLMRLSYADFCLNKKSEIHASAFSSLSNNVYYFFCILDKARS